MISKKDNHEQTLRHNTRSVMVGNVQIGGQNDVVIQTMLTEKPRNYNECIKKINNLAKRGCQIVRVACFTSSDIDGISKICNKINIPLVADIQYNYHYAIDAIKAGASKIRINPGNIGKDKIAILAKFCRKKKIPIRIGINSGSIEPDLLLRYGFTAKALVKSAIRNVKILEDNNFYDIVISLKSSMPDVVIDAYTQASKIFSYPLHLGLTEAGSLIRATVKSSCSLGELLKIGIGDTIRISISDDSVHEITVAKSLLSYYGIKKNLPNLISCPTCGRLDYKMLPLVREIETYLEELTGKVNVAIMGCSVNGPGEAKHADIALFGENQCAHLYIHGKFVRTIVNAEVATEFKKEISKYLQLQKNNIKN